MGIQYATRNTSQQRRETRAYWRETVFRVGHDVHMSVRDIGSGLCMLPVKEYRAESLS